MRTDITQIIASHAGLEVRQMVLTWQKTLLIWHTLNSFRTLFSDLTRGDLRNYLNYISAPGTLWLEITKGNELIGLVVCDGLERVVDINAHVMFFDRDLGPERIPLCKQVVKWLFATFPIQRITVEVPVIYYATVRLIKELKFVREGMKRGAVLLGGRWKDVYVYGLTRQEALTL